MQGSPLTAEACVQGGEGCGGLLKTKYVANSPNVSADIRHECSKREELKVFLFFLFFNSGGDGRLLTEAPGSGSRVFKRY